MSSFTEAANRAAEEHSIQRRVIPEGSIVTAVLFEIGFTNAGKEINSILGGIQAKFCFIDFEKDGVKTQLINFDGDEVDFPWDDPNLGKDGYAGLFSKPIYLTPGTLKYRQVSEPQTVEAAVLLYSHALTLDLGPNIQEPFGRCLLQSGLIDISSFNFADLGVTPDFVNADYGFPAVRVFRETWMSYDKKDIDPKTKKPKPGAEKRFNERLTTLDKSVEPYNNDLAELPVTFIPSNKVLKIYKALQVRQEIKKLAAGNSDLPF